MEDDNKVYKKQIGFILSVPDTKMEADIQALVLRLHELRMYINRPLEDTEYFGIKNWNKTIEEMQGILEIMKVKGVENYESK